MELDRPLYTITLDSEEVEYLTQALERGFCISHGDDPIDVWLVNAGEGTQVILNETGYGLVSHLQFGGVNRAKMWARLEGVA